jgi:hypothetical protein
MPCNVHWFATYIEEFIFILQNYNVCFFHMDVVLLLAFRFSSQFFGDIGEYCSWTGSHMFHAYTFSMYIIYKENSILVSTTKFTVE